MVLYFIFFQFFLWDERLQFLQSSFTQSSLMAYIFMVVQICQVALNKSMEIVPANHQLCFMNS